MPGVVFEENQGFEPLAAPTPAPPTMSGSLFNAHIVQTRGEATVILLVVAIALIGFAFYLLVSSVKAPPTLGSDVLRPGEVPAYAQ